MSKLVDCIVVKQLLQCINRNNLDNPEQSAYKTGPSRFISLSHGEPTALVLLSLSAAFDKTDHTTLLDCLKSWFGVFGAALTWFTSYLSH